MSCRMKREDHAVLREYFGHGGMARLEQSPIGYQLAMLERHGRMRRCSVCCGVGRLPPGAKAVRRHATAIETKVLARAWVTLQLSTVRVAKQDIGEHLSEYRNLRDVQHAMHRAETYRRKHAEEIRQEAEAEHGPRGKAAERLMMAEAAAIRSQEPIPDDGWCHVCNGVGWVAADHPGGSEPTARPTGSSKTAESAMELDETTIERLGCATRILRRVNPKHHPVFAHYYDPPGGVSGVWEITPAGVALVRQHRAELEKAKQERDLAPWQILHEVCEEQRHSPTLKRGRQLDTMREQARDLVRDAVKAWCEARDGSFAKVRSLVPQKSRKRIRAPKSEALDQMATMVRELLAQGAA